MFGGRSLVFSLAGQQSVRNSSGKLKELGLRKKSVSNIRKITKTMNMISSAKYAKAAKTLETARTFGNAAAGVISAAEKAEGYKPVEGEHVFIATSSDRGLCGAFHNNLAKETGEACDAHGNGKLVCSGEKSRVALARTHQDSFLLTAKEIGRQVPTFADAGILAQEIINSGYDFKAGTVFYNKHHSAMTQKPATRGLASKAGLENLPGIEAYDSVDEDVLTSFSEFALASTMYSCMAENYISEQAARMISMDGATKNAGEMIEKMEIQYNRMRQAVITTELCEIIAGMAAIE